MIFRATLSSRPKPYGETAGRRPIGLVVAILLHMLVLWLALTSPPIQQKKAGQGKQESDMLWMQPLAQVKPPAKPVPKDPSPPRQPPRTTPRQMPPQVVQTAPPPPAVQELPTITTPPPEPDMAADLAKKRRLREQAQTSHTAQETGSAEDESQRAVARAQANLANLQARAGNAGRAQHGGVFKLDRVSYHRAEYTFNGWNKNFKRQMPTRIEVELGNEGDIETAIVNSMIVLIRKERSAEFSWESHRLGRVVELNARPEFTAELQAFLMREFFPEHRVGRRH